MFLLPDPDCVFGVVTALLNGKAEISPWRIPSALTEMRRHGPNPDNGIPLIIPSIRWSMWKCVSSNNLLSAHSVTVTSTKRWTTTHSLPITSVPEPISRKAVKDWLVELRPKTVSGQANSTLQLLESCSRCNCSARVLHWTTYVACCINGEGYCQSNYEPGKRRLSHKRAPPNKSYSPRQRFLNVFWSDVY